MGFVATQTLVILGDFKDLTGFFFKSRPLETKKQNNLACMYFSNGSGKIKHQLGDNLRLFNIPWKHMTFFFPLYQEPNFMDPFWIYRNEAAKNILNKKHWILFFILLYLGI